MITKFLNYGRCGVLFAAAVTSLFFAAHCGPLDVRTVEFPRDFLAGLWIVDVDRLDQKHAWSGEMRPAQGKIVIPPGKKLALRVLSEDGEAVDLSPLDQLGPTDLYALAVGMADIIPASELARLRKHEALRILSLGPMSRIRGDFLSAIAQVPSLRTLKVKTEIDTVTDAEFAHIEKLAHLEVLVLIGESDEWQITNRGLRHLRNLTKLRELNIGGPRISDEGLKHLQNLTQLEKLTLQGKNITGPGLQYLTGLDRLRELDLSNTGLTDEGLVHLAQLDTLESLNLSGTPVTGEGLAYLSGLDRLESLNLSRTEVQDFALRHLDELADLKYLRLSLTDLTNEGLKHLMSLKQLRQLSILETRITEEAVAEFKQAVPGCTVHYSHQEPKNTVPFG